MAAQGPVPSSSLLRGSILISFALDAPVCFHLRPTPALLVFDLVFFYLGHVGAAVAIAGTSTFTIVAAGVIDRGLSDGVRKDALYIECHSLTILGLASQLYYAR